MSEFLQPPKIDLLNQLLPCQPWVTCHDRASEVCVAIQVNVFNCGRIVIGVCVLHTITDGITVSAFLKSWASITRGGGANEQLFSLDFTTASTLFPPRNLASLTYSNRVMLAWEKEAISVTRRFVFDPNAIATLKAKAKGEYVSNPTRYEALTALVWKCLINASTTISGDMPLPRPSLLEYVVDIRRRVGEPLSTYSIGNMIIVANAMYDPADTNISLQEYLATIVRQSIEEANGDFLRSLQGDEGFFFISGYAEMLKKVVPESLGFTNWCNFGFKEIDFGWGKPLWVGHSEGLNVSFVNRIHFKDIECDEGIEAWVTLDKKEMAVFENDPNLLAFALSNPTVSRP